jgi:hypothetical protein
VYRGLHARREITAVPRSRSLLCRPVCTAQGVGGATGAGPLPHAVGHGGVRCAHVRVVQAAEVRLLRAVLLPTLRQLLDAAARVRPHARGSEHWHDVVHPAPVPPRRHPAHAQVPQGKVPADHDSFPLAASVSIRTIRRVSPNRRRRSRFVARSRFRFSAAAESAPLKAALLRCRVQPPHGAAFSLSRHTQDDDLLYVSHTNMVAGLLPYFLARDTARRRHVLVVRVLPCSHAHTHSPATSLRD